MQKQKVIQPNREISEENRNIHTKKHNIGEQYPLKIPLSKRGYIAQKVRSGSENPTKKRLHKQKCSISLTMGKLRSPNKIQYQKMANWRKFTDQKT